MVNLIEYLVDLGFDAGKDIIEQKISEHEQKNRLKDYIERQRNINELSTFAEEIDFEGWAEYLSRGFLEDVKKRLFGNKKERAAARNTLISNSVTYARAENEISRKRVMNLTDKAVDILRGYYRSTVGYGDLLVAAEIEDMIEESIKDSTDIAKAAVQASTEKIVTEIQSLKAEHSPLTLERYLAMAESSDFSGIEAKLNQTIDVISCRHPLAPDYRFTYKGNHLLSIPVSKDAMISHPPKFIVSGPVKVGDRPINTLHTDAANYAYRHQLDITMNIEDAKKFLGSAPDPIQTEALNMIGGKAIIKPKPFPPAFPCSILADGEVVWEYVEMRTQEILDDGTFLVSNKEQANCHIRLLLSVNLTNRRGSLSLHTDHPENRDLLLYGKLLQKLSNSKKAEIRMLGVGKNLLEGFINIEEYHGGFTTLDEEIDFLEGIVAIENYFGLKVEIPTSIHDGDLTIIHYLASLIKGESCQSTWSQVSFNVTMNDRLRESILADADKPIRLIFDGNMSVDLFGNTYELEVKRTYDNAVFRDLKKLKKKISVLDNGDPLTLTYIPANGNEQGNVVDELGLK